MKKRKEDIKIESYFDLKKGETINRIEISKRFSDFLRATCNYDELSKEELKERDYLERKHSFLTYEIYRKGLIENLCLENIDNDLIRSLKRFDLNDTLYEINENNNRTNRDITDYKNTILELNKSLENNAILIKEINKLKGVKDETKTKI